MGTIWRLPRNVVSVITNRKLFLDLPIDAVIRQQPVGSRIEFIDEHGDVTCKAQWLGNDVAEMVAD